MTERDLTFDRCWRPLAKGPFGKPDWTETGWKLYVHRVPPGDGEAFFHPHPWPMAVHVLGPGKYEMGIGFGPPVGLHGVDYEADKPDAHVINHAPAGYQYELLDGRVWHYIRAREAEVYSIMISAPGFTSAHHEAHEPLTLEPHVGLTDTQLISICRGLFEQRQDWYHL